MSASDWYVRQRQQAVDGHWLTVAGGGRHGQSTVDGVVIEACDEVARNGLVHAVDSFLPSALRTHLRQHRAPGRRADIWALLDALFH